MTYQFITFNVDQGVAVVTLNRPDVLNSFNERMASEVQDALAHARDDEGVRCVYMTGAGRAFCAGQDLASLESPKEGARPNLGPVVRTQYNPIVRLIRTTEKPFVCGVNGVAAGAGANLALSCDLVVASDRASFIQSFCKVGLVPDTGGTFLLPRLIGQARAASLFMTGEKLSAQDAADLGLVYKVYPADEFAESAVAFARGLASQPTAGLGLIKRALNASVGNSLDEQLELEAELQQAAGETNDYAEGVRAFLEKRPAAFSGS